ncbi:MAG: hypothetical protein KC468_17490 [Myxococcales bacterium]|nr:hypothetical protein [Myxococcales bacterium]
MVDNTDGEAVFSDDEVAQEIEHVNDYFSLSDISFVVSEIRSFTESDEVDDARGSDHITLVFYRDDAPEVAGSCGSVPALGPMSQPLAIVKRSCTWVTGGGKKTSTSHELGHALGLPHTHGSLSNVEALDSECYTDDAGDYLCDTPPDPYEGCDAVINDGICEVFCDADDLPGYKPNPDLVMSYYADSCQSSQTAFSQEQINQMRCVVDNSYADIQSCVSPECANNKTATGSIAAPIDKSTQSGLFTVSGNVTDPDGIAKITIAIDTLQDCKFSVLPQGGSTEFSFEISVDPESCNLGDGEHTAGLWTADDCGVPELLDSIKFIYDSDCVPEPQAFSDCIGDDVHWFDSCGGPGALKEDCGSDGYEDASYCQGGDVWRDFIEVGCSNSACTTNPVPMLQQDCGGDGCSNGSCNNNMCTSQSYAQCNSGDVYWYDSCDNLGSKKEECGSDGYVGGLYCMSGDVYRDYKTAGCQGASCTENVAPQKQEDCGVNGCSNGVCNEPQCVYDVDPQAPSFSYSAPYTCPGGIVMPISGSINPNTGYLTISSPEKDGDFGAGTYRVFVFDPNVEISKQCKDINVVKATKVVNVTTPTLTFSAFDSLLECNVEDKAYCIGKEAGGSKTHFCSGKLVASYNN